MEKAAPEGAASGENRSDRGRAGFPESLEYQVGTR